MTGPELELSKGSLSIYAEITWRLIQCLTCSQPLLEKTITVYEMVPASIYGGEGEDIREEIPTTFEPSIEYPIQKIGATPKPGADMPKEVLKVYNEARIVFASSPRASAALLRLALQLLCKHLGQPGESINTDIKNLVKQGLPLKTQQALDIVRVMGNNAVHPGEINLNDEPIIASFLFHLINYIVRNMITRPSQEDRISEVYEMLPEGTRKEIEKRDKK